MSMTQNRRSCRARFELAELEPRRLLSTVAAQAEIRPLAVPSAGSPHTAHFQNVSTVVPLSGSVQVVAVKGDPFLRALGISASGASVNRLLGPIQVTVANNLAVGLTVSSRFVIFETGLATFTPQGGLVNSDAYSGTGALSPNGHTIHGTVWGLIFYGTGAYPPTHTRILAPIGHFGMSMQLNLGSGTMTGTLHLTVRRAV